MDRKIQRDTFDDPHQHSLCDILKGSLVERYSKEYIYSMSKICFWCFFALFVRVEWESSSSYYTTITQLAASILLNAKLSKWTFIYIMPEFTSLIWHARHNSISNYSFLSIIIIKENNNKKMPVISRNTVHGTVTVLQWQTMMKENMTTDNWESKDIHNILSIEWPWPLQWYWWLPFPKSLRISTVTTTVLRAGALNQTMSVIIQNRNFRKNWLPSVFGFVFGLLN